MSHFGAYKARIILPESAGVRYVDIVGIVIDDPHVADCRDNTGRKCGQMRKHLVPLRIEGPDGEVKFDFTKTPWKRYMFTASLDANMDEFERESNNRMAEIASRRKGQGRKK